MLEVDWSIFLDWNDILDGIVHVTGTEFGYKLIGNSFDTINDWLNGLRVLGNLLRLASWHLLTNHENDLVLNLICSEWAHGLSSNIDIDIEFTIKEDLCDLVNELLLLVCSHFTKIL